MKKKLTIYLLLAGLFLTVSCEEENQEIAPGNTSEPVFISNIAGFGNTPGTPTGTPFSLTENVKLITPITGYVPDYSSYPKYGIGSIPSYFILENPNNFDITVEFPAGLIFLPDNDSSQTGLNSRPVLIAINAGSTEKVCLRLFCMNKHKNAGYVNFYTPYVISDNDQVASLTTALQVKSEIALVNHSWEVQNMVWHITDGPGITQADLDLIQGW